MVSPNFESFIQKLKAKNPNEPEFIQAVTEVSDDIIPYMEMYHPVYLDFKVLERIIEPERVISFRVCWYDDDGKVQINRGYRVQMSSTLGPYKGGLRFCPTVNLSVLKFLAFEC